jgi:hypothetical protein
LLPVFNSLPRTAQPAAVASGLTTGASTEGKQRVRRGGRGRAKARKDEEPRAKASPPAVVNTEPVRARLIKNSGKIPPGAGGKRLCLSFSKGSCKRGDSCQWGHDCVLTLAELSAVYGE